jgi:branched-chain amino acid transport system permease protein
MENYLIAMLVFAGLYGLMALGLNIIWGMAGMVNLGLVGFMAVGAYTSAMLTVRFATWPIWAGVLAGTLAAALSGAVLVRLTAHLRGDYMAIVSLGFAEAVRVVAANSIAFTNGTDGISGIPGPWRGVLAPSGFNLVFLAIVGVAVGLALFAAQRIRHSPHGRVLRAIRDDDQAAQVAGKDVLRFRMVAYAVGAGIVGLAGALYGHFNAYVAPELFVPLLTISIKLGLTLGGTGNNIGALVGTLLVVVLLEGSRFLVHAIPWLEPVQVAALREIAIGALMIAVLRWRPGGLIPEVPPRRFG